MAASNSWRHDPDAVLDYTIDWSAWLGDGETIALSTWDVPGGATGLTEVSDTATSTETSVRISGGTAGTWYEVTNHIITSTGQEEDRTIKLFSSER
jgi:hypothetical protein